MAQGQVAYSLTGGNGSVFINDTSTHTGPFMAIQAVNGAQAVINPTSTQSNIDDFDANLTIDSGQTVYGQFANCTLVSGAVLAYYR
tara:strand:- start:509 stop:766 length:258 start_codon:yes stop_codon:yes gene_type:complete